MKVLTPQQYDVLCAFYMRRLVTGVTRHRWRVACGHLSGGARSTTQRLSMETVDRAPYLHYHGDGISRKYALYSISDAGFNAIMEQRALEEDNLTRAYARRAMAAINEGPPAHKEYVDTFATWTTDEHDIAQRHLDLLHHRTVIVLSDYVRRVYPAFNITARSYMAYNPGMALVQSCAKDPKTGRSEIEFMVSGRHEGEMYANIIENLHRELDQPAFQGE